MKYDKYMDKDCIELCDTLNSLNGIKGENYVNI
jgi:hypothetical protein